MLYPFLQLICICIIQLSTVNHDKHKIIDVYVEPYKALSYGAFFKSLSLKTQPESIEYIEGFEFEWGYSYQLKVEQTLLEHPPEDGSSAQYKLIKVLSKTKAEEGFTFRLNLEREVYLGGDHANALKQIDDSTYIYFDEITISVPLEHQKRMNELIKSKNKHTALFSLNDSKAIKLIKFE